MDRTSTIILLLAWILSWPVVDAAAQDVAISCRISAADLPAQEIVFGLAAEAAVGIDAFDLPCPPPPPDEPFLVYLRMIDPEAPTLDRWRREFHPAVTGPDTWLEIWEMTIEHAPVGETLHLETEIEAGETFPYVLSLTDAYGTSREIPLGSAMDLPVTAPTMTLHWLLGSDHEIPVSPTTWGGFKATFGR